MTPRSNLDDWAFQRGCEDSSDIIGRTPAQGYLEDDNYDIPDEESEEWDGFSFEDDETPRRKVPTDTRD